MTKIIIYSAVVFVVLLITIIVAIATSKNKKLNKTSEVIRELLPNINCGSCGRPNCVMFAEDVEKGRTTISNCPYLIGKNYLRCRKIIKKQRKAHFDVVAFVKCKGGCDCKSKYEYIGDQTCSSKNLQHAGDKFCSVGCLGCGDCVKSCVYGAISISEKGCAVVNKDKCVGCGECVASCPNKLISLIPSNKFVEVVCKNTSNDSLVTRNCEVSCTHCEACVVACPVGAIKMVGNLPHIDKNKCVKCGKCVASCPNHVISRI